VVAIKDCSNQQTTKMKYEYGKEIMYMWKKFFFCYL
jgi:hypothetical protein